VFVGRGGSAIFPGTANLTNVTLYNNASTVNPAAGNVGNSQAVVNVTRSIVSNGGCTGGVTSGGFNMNGANDCPGIGTAAGDRINGSTSATSGSPRRSAIGAA
jgi:hypothetical protein